MLNSSNSVHFITILIFVHEDLQTEIITTTDANTGNLYPAAPEGVTGHDALQARTKLWMQQSADVDLDIEAVGQFGTLYDDLPGDYGNSHSAGE